MCPWRIWPHRSSGSDIRLLPRKRGPTVAARPRRGACRAGDTHHRGLQIVAHSPVCRGTDGRGLSVGFALLGSTVAGVSTRLFAALSRLANVTQSGSPTARTRRSRSKFRRHQRSCQLSRLQPGGEAVRTLSAGRPSQPLVGGRRKQCRSGRPPRADQVTGGPSSPLPEGGSGQLLAGRRIRAR